jgi:hypothetical protein
MLTIGTQKSDRITTITDTTWLELTTSNFLPSLHSDRVTEIVNSCFGKSVLEVEVIINTDKES